MTHAATEPLVSVLLPVFNAEKYISEAIESIQNQSFRDFELLIINDGSTDGTLGILQQHKKTDDRIVIISRANKGLVDTLNEGIDVARGQWIARMDADDVALPNRLALQLAVLEQTGADICGGGIEFFGTSDRRIIKHPIGDNEIKAALYFGSAFAHPTVVMKTELIRQLRYDQQWEKCEDYDLWQRAVYAGWKMANVPEVILRYRQHEAQISTAAWGIQQDLTHKLRRRHWLKGSTEMGIKTEWIDELMKLREPSPIGVNLNFVNLAIGALMQHTTNEARLIVLDHAFRLYARAAASSPNVVDFWKKLNKEFGLEAPSTAVFKLRILRLFRISPDGSIFEQVKRLAMGGNRFFTINQ